LSVYKPQTKENSRGAVDSAEKVGVGVVELLTETTATARPFAKDGGVKPLRNRARSSTGRPAQTISYKMVLGLQDEVKVSDRVRWQS